MRYKNDFNDVNQFTGRKMTEEKTEARKTYLSFIIPMTILLVLGSLLKYFGY